MNVLHEVPEVEPQSIQRQSRIANLQLRGDPIRTIDVGHPLIGLRGVELQRLSANVDPDLLPRVCGQNLM